MSASFSPETAPPRQTAAIYVAERQLPTDLRTYDMAKIQAELLKRGFTSAEIVPALASSHPTLLEKVLQLVRKCFRVELSHALHAAQTQPALALAGSEISGIPLGMYKLLLRKRGQKTTVVTIAHKIHDGTKAKLQHLIHWLYGVDVILCSNQLQADYLTRRNLLPPGCKAMVCHIGIDTDRFKPRPENLEPNDHPYFLCVGKEERNYPLLIQAMRIIDEQGLSPALRVKIFAGSKWMSENHQQLGELPSNIIVSDQFVSDEEIVAAYQSARAVLLPLNDTNLQQAAGANGLLEALATGKVTLVTRTPGLDEYLNPFNPREPGVVPLYRSEQQDPLQTIPPSITAEQLARILVQLWDRAPRVPGQKLLDQAEIVQKYFSHQRYVEQVVSTLAMAMPKEQLVLRSRPWNH